VPQQGKYEKFDGTLKQVEQFTVQTGMPVPVQQPEARAANQQAMPSHVEAGPSELEVQLPVSGTLFRFEKILVVKDQQWFSYAYRNLTKK